jgi:hypothetical protein
LINISLKHFFFRCRYGAAELHTISSFIGGAAAQEAIKIITRQFVPFNNTYIYNAMKQSSLTVQLWYYFMYTIETDTSEFDFNLFPPLLFWLLSQYTIEQWQYKLSLIFHLYRITVVLKVETDMITSIAASPKDKVRYKWWCMSIPSKLHVIYIYYCWFIWENGFLKAISHQRRSLRCEMRGEVHFEKNISMIVCLLGIWK